jgi:hypothetical protein
MSYCVFSAKEIVFCVDYAMTIRECRSLLTQHMRMAVLSQQKRNVLGQYPTIRKKDNNNPTLLDLGLIYAKIGKYNCYEYGLSDF